VIQLNEPLMYVVLVGLVILVFGSIMPKGQTKTEGAGSPQLVKEMEETMEGFLAELEEDNQKLIDTMSVMRQDHDAAIRKLADRIDGMEKQLQEQRLDLHRIEVQRIERQEAEMLVRSQAAFAAVQAASEQRSSSHSPVLPSTTHDDSEAEDVQPHTTIKGRYQELFRMHEEGKSIEYIAKKNGMNKGEVSLIIQLAEQEDRKGAQK
jgi:hypothetical protein